MNTYSMLRRRSHALVAASAFLTAACSDDNKDVSPRFDEAALRADVETVQKTADIVGVLAEVVTPEGPLRARAGAAELGTNQPVPWDAHFRVASTTKTFVATVVLQLVGEGKLSLEDPVEKWLPGVVRGQGNDGNKVTVRQLLQHTSGLFDYVEDEGLQSAMRQDFEGIRYNLMTPEELVAIAMKHPPAFAPGQGWSYSNTGYLVAGMIIKAITGHDWSHEVVNRIAVPLGLTQTSVTTTDPKVPVPYARTYLRVEGAPSPLETTENTLEHTADSAVISTTADLNRFFRELVTGKVLRASELTEMQRTVPMPEGDYPAGTRAGLGIFWSPTSCGGFWQHAGDSPVAPHTRTGITADGRRSIIVSMTSTVDFASTDRAVFELTERALCDRAR
ncbi:serine hydrolase domain-containing protein [Pendulispora albinea]|uniref:Beta-lactamase family protein n=1 Tax=Pendulispora albinea TaxID=2741071 RepID=A0ABZ2LTN5_9BACT